MTAYYYQQVMRGVCHQVTSQWLTTAPPPAAAQVRSYSLWKPMQLSQAFAFPVKDIFVFFSWCDFSLQSDHSRSIRCASYIIPNYYDFNEFT